MSMSHEPDHSLAEINLALPPEAKIHLYREMVRIRAFELTALQYYQGGNMGGNGDSVYEIRAKLKPAIERAYLSQLPTVLEIATYRFEGFTVADANKFRYRSRQEVEERQINHDPLKLWSDQLLRGQCVGEDELKRIKAEAFEEAKGAAMHAKASALPEPAAMMKDVYWEVDHATAAGMTGRHFFND